MYRTMRKFLRVMALAALPLAAAPQESDTLRHFRYVRPAVRHDTAGETSWYVIPFDSILYEAVDDFSTDLRLTREKGKEIPFLVEPHTEPATGYREDVLPGRFTATQTLPDGRKALEFELEEQALVAALEITPPEGEFQTVLSVAVGDGGNWETALPEFLFRAAPDRNQRVRRFQFPAPVTGRLVRLIFGAAQAPRIAAPVAVEGLKVIRKTPYEIPDSPVLKPAFLTEISRTETPDHTILILRSDRAPLRRFLFSAANDFFQRRVTVAGSDNRKTWLPITGGTIQKIDSDTALSLDIPESRFSFYRLVIRNEHNAAPLSGLRVSAMRSEMRIVFTAGHGSETLLLYYGGKAPEPVWDKNQFAPAFREGAPGLYELGAQQDNTARPELHFATGSKHWIFSILLLAAAGGVLAVIVRNLGKISRELPED